MRPRSGLAGARSNVNNRSLRLANGRVADPHVLRVEIVALDDQVGRVAVAELEDVEAVELRNGRLRSAGIVVEDRRNRLAACGGTRALGAQFERDLRRLGL